MGLRRWKKACLTHLTQDISSSLRCRLDNVQWVITQGSRIGTFTHSNQTARLVLCTGLDHWKRLWETNNKTERREGRRRARHDLYLVVLSSACSSRYQLLLFTSMQSTGHGDTSLQWRCHSDAYGSGRRKAKSKRVLDFTFRSPNSHYRTQVKSMDCTKD